MRNPLIIAGKEIERNPFQCVSPFYPDYTYQVANAGPLDVASAIGAARQADRRSLADRAGWLRRAAAAFTYDRSDLEHTVRLTGVPVSQVARLAAEIPHILRQVPACLAGRFTSLGAEKPHQAEIVAQGRYRVLVPVEGFCYAITPGNDPRAAALVAANLGYLGLPFVLRASIRDGLAPLVIRALIAGGFDPRFCNLIYSDRSDPLAGELHLRLVDASQVIWTFGPAAAVDQNLRYEQTGQRAYLDLAGLDVDSNQLPALAETLAGLGAQEMQKRLRLEAEQRDHFAGKLVLRHASATCAAVVQGALDEPVRQLLSASLGFPSACTAARAIMVVQGERWVEEAAGFLAGLVPGDPLDPATQVGYVDPRCIDYLEAVVRQNRLRVTTYGGERLSPIQAAPLLVVCREETPDFLTQEIPAGLLALREFNRLAEAVAELDRHAPEGENRLAVSFYNVPKDQLARVIFAVRAHTLLVDRPTTTLIPYFHEGNDYASLLAEDRLLVL